MKRKIIFHLIVFAIGIVLILISFIPLRLNFQLPYHLGFFGLAITVSAFISGLTLIARNRVSRFKQISSRLTPIYKYYLPTTFFTCLLFNSFLIFFDVYPGSDISNFIAIEILLVVWLILSIPCIRLSMVYFSDKQIVVFNYSSELKLKVKSIQSIKRYLIFFYRIKITDEKVSSKFIILPKLTEFYSLFITPKSIKELRSQIR